jgi:hypothetical protein
MSNRKIEALALGIAALNDFGNPDSKAFQLMNPGLSRAYSFKTLANTDKDGLRIFSSVIGGLRFLVQDLTWKIDGSSRAKSLDGSKIKPTHKLADLLHTFKLNSDEHLFTLLDFLSRALKTDEISFETQLSYFLQKEENRGIL